MRDDDISFQKTILKVAGFDFGQLAIPTAHQMLTNRLKPDKTYPVATKRFLATTARVSWSKSEQRSTRSALRSAPRFILRATWLATVQTQSSLLLIRELLGLLFLILFSYLYCGFVLFFVVVDWLCSTCKTNSLKPKSLSFAEAAAVPLVALTVWEPLFESLRLATDG